MGGMSVEVETRDASSLTEGQLEDLAAMGGAFALGAITKAKEDWVLFTVALLVGQVARVHVLDARAHRGHSVRAHRTHEREAFR